MALMAAAGGAATVLLENLAKEWNYNYIEGSIKKGDRLLLHEKFERKWTVGRRVMEIPYTGEETISYIEVKSLWCDGTGGDVTVRKGGVGKSFVVIRFTSQLFRGIAFEAKIYGQMES